MFTHLLVVDLEHLENCVLLPAFQRGYHSLELHYPNSSATAQPEEGEQGDFQGDGIAARHTDL